MLRKNVLSVPAEHVFSKVEVRTTAVVDHMLKRSPVLAPDPISYSHIKAVLSIDRSCPSRMSHYKEFTGSLMEEGRRDQSWLHDDLENKKYLLNSKRSTLSDGKFIATSKLLDSRGVWWDGRRWQQ